MVHETFRANRCSGRICGDSYGCHDGRVCNLDGKRGEELMENAKLPIALVVAMIVQISGGVWWVSQQAATIKSLEEAVSQMSSRMAIEDGVNLRRDVSRNSEEIEDLWETMDSQSMIMTRQIELLGRMSTLEREMEIFSRDHFQMDTHPGR